MLDERTAGETSQSAKALLPDEYGVVKKFQLAVELLACYLSLPVEVILHRQFGRRYLTWWTAVAVVLCLLLGSFIVDGDFVRLPPIDAAPVVRFVLWFGCSFTRLFCLVFAVCCYRHIMEIWRPIWAGVKVRRHTRYVGRPYSVWEKVFPGLARWLEPHQFEFFIKRFTEPLLAILAGLLLLPFTTPFGTVTVFCGMALFLKANLEHARLTGRMLDIADGLIEAQFLQMCVTTPGTKLAAADGFALPVTASVRPVLEKATAGPTVQEAIRGLSAELKAIMTPPPVRNGKHHASKPSNGEERLAIRCPGCERDGKVPPAAEGRTITCPCGTSFVAPFRERRTK